MKKLKILKGVKTLDKKEQKTINGSNWGGRNCFQQGVFCCTTFSSGFQLCEPGRCINGSCLWY